MFEQLFLERGSSIHRLDLWTKVWSLLIVVPLATFLTSPTVVMLVFIFVLSLLILSRVRLSVLWGQGGAYYILFPLGTLLLSLVFSEGNLLYRLFRGMDLSMRFITVITAALLFSIVTDPIEIPLGVLKIKVPHRYGVAMMVAIRMMPLISRKLTNIVEAQRTRGARFSLSPAELPRLPKQLMSLLVPAMLSTLEASVALSDTLLARGYNPNKPITRPPTHLGLGDFGLAIVSLLLLVIVLLIH